MTALTLSVHPRRVGVALGTSDHMMSFSLPASDSALRARLDRLVAAFDPDHFAIVSKVRSNKDGRSIASYLEGAAQSRDATVERLSRKTVRAQWVGGKGCSDSQLVDEAEARQFYINSVEEIEAVAALDLALRQGLPEPT